MNIVKYLYKILRLPKTVFRFLSKKISIFYNYIYSDFFYYRHLINIKRIRRRLNRNSESKVNICFFVVHSSTWIKIDSVYNLFNSDSRFNVNIVICPVIDYGYENMIDRMNDCKRFFTLLNYNYILGYDNKKNELYDIKKNLDPDIIFYNNPYKGLVHEYFYIDNYPNSLTCYIPYFYGELTSSFLFDLDFHKKIWRYYIDTESNKKVYDLQLGYYRKNHKVVGFPMYDCGIRKIEHKKKIIIWSPHHSIEPAYTLNGDSFIKYYSFMLEMARKYSDIIFVFRPHPLLKNKLYNDTRWGKDKTDNYYEMWNSIPNTRLSEESDYRDLFFSSDALIHDCASYRIEYLATLNRVLYTGRRPDDKISSPAGIDAMNCHEYADSESEIESFIISIYKSEPDELCEKKKNFVDKYFNYKNKASENIFSDIKKSLHIQ